MRSKSVRVPVHVGDSTLTMFCDVRAATEKIYSFYIVGSESWHGPIVAALKLVPSRPQQRWATPEQIGKSLLEKVVMDG